MLHNRDHACMRELLEIIEWYVVYSKLRRCVAYYLSSSLHDIQESTCLTYVCLDVFDLKLMRKVPNIFSFPVKPHIK